MTHAPTTLFLASLGLVIVTLMTQTAEGTVPESVPAASSPPAQELALSPRVDQPEVVIESILFAFPSDEIVYANAVATFEAGGFVVPDFLARFHTTTEPCRGHFGLHVRTSAGVSTVNVCRTMDREMAQQIAREHTLMHEMAHAWIAQNVTLRQMEALMALRGLTVWEGAGEDWHRLGAEHAAEILLWGMTDGARNLSFQIDQDDTAELAAAYEILVGETSSTGIAHSNGRS